MLVDDYNRPVDYLRISVNRSCNYRCVYCDREGYQSDEEVMLSPGDVERIVRIFNEVGNIQKVKITGGEPLLHPEIVDIVKAIASTGEIVDISMTTNGFLLAPLAGSLKAAGLGRVNISLCSVNPENFQRITGVDGLDAVIAGIDAAKEAGLGPIKINFVLMKGINDGELENVLAFSAEKEVRLQLIELHQIDDIECAGAVFFDTHFLDADEALASISLPVERIEYRDLQHRKITHYTNGTSVETVKMSPSFCEQCTKIRITADGRIKPCLMRQASAEYNLLSALRNGASPEEIRAMILDAVQERKPYLQNDVEACQ
jgi:cyclic pyranopterin phosphate synthase